MKDNLYGGGGSYESFLLLPESAPGSHGFASAAAEAPRPSQIELIDNSNAPDKKPISFTGFFSLGHGADEAATQVLAAGYRQQQDHTTAESSTFYYDPNDRQPQYLNSAVLPPFLAYRPHDPPPRQKKGCEINTTAVSTPPWPRRTDVGDQNPLSALRWQPSELGLLAFPMEDAAGAYVCDGGYADGFMGTPTSSVFCGFDGELGVMRRELKDSNSTEKQRRGKMSEKFCLLRSLMPNPIKHDKASIISEATDYIKELLRTTDELCSLLEVKKRTMAATAAGRSTTAPHSRSYFPAEEPPSQGLLRCSWMQRVLKGTSIDVRIVEDDVTIKLVRRGKDDCLLLVAVALQELQLDILHLAAGNIGDSAVLTINSRVVIPSDDC